MTREEAKKFLPVMTAFANGAKIQLKFHNGDWADVESPAFIKGSEYRIKPEPEYIPFDFSDAEYLIGKAVKHKDTCEVTILGAIGSAKIEEFPARLGNGNWITFDELVSDYVFLLDGSPCGKLKQ